MQQRQQTQSRPLATRKTPPLNPMKKLRPLQRPGHRSLALLPGMAPLLLAPLMLLLSSAALWADTATFTPGVYSWQCPPGISNVTVECWGGGGAGGSTHTTVANVSWGGGGAGGDYARSIVSVTPGNYYNIVAGGGAPLNPNVTPIAGTNSWFGIASSRTTNVLAQGGTGAVGQTVNAYGIGGIAASNLCKGTTVFTGGNGGRDPINPPSGAGLLWRWWGKRRTVQ